MSYTTSSDTQVSSLRSRSPLGSSCNLVCELSNFQKHHVYFTETCKNNIVNGTFTKIQYSDSMISFHGIFLYFPLQVANMNTPNNLRASFSLSKDSPVSVPCDTKATSVPLTLPPWFSDTIPPKVVLPEIDETLQQNSASLRMMCRVNSVPDTCDGISQHRHQIWFSPTHPINYNTIKDLNQIEYHLMEYYKQYRGQTHKQNVYSLRNQLRTGNLRIYVYATDEPPVKTNESFYVLKISGVWETATHVGITYKFMHIGCPIVMHK